MTSPQYTVKNGDGKIMQCPKCEQRSRKDGWIRGKQRWECTNPLCNYKFVSDPQPVGAPLSASHPPCPYCRGVLHKQRQRKSQIYYRCQNCGKYVSQYSSPVSCKA
jgi:ssDNA-binding Zn-finger/Zn-ribbon topoisomerase 1